MHAELDDAGAVQCTGRDIPYIGQTLLHIKPRFKASAYAKYDVAEYDEVVPNNDAAMMAVSADHYFKWMDAKVGFFTQLLGSACALLGFTFYACGKNGTDQCVWNDLSRLYGMRRPGAVVRRRCCTGMCR